MNKDELLDALEDERENFLDAIESLTDEQMLQPGVAGEWSVRDILFHLCMWEAELVKLLWQASQGQKPTTVHFSATPMDATNAAWAQAAAERPLENLFDDFAAVRKQTERRLSGFADRELTDPQAFPWLKGRPLWEWIAEDSFRHEAEHAGQIKEWRSKNTL